ncbi:MAG: hypothetical protein KDB03_05300 [Planctomycetales bacterium]|nr:hypothetical protein [Planctomycetales bacterium]
MYISIVRIHIIGVVLLSCLMGATYWIGYRALADIQLQSEEAYAENELLASQLISMESNADLLRLDIGNLKQELKNRYPVKIPVNQSVLDTISTILAEHDIKLENLIQQNRTGQIQAIDMQLLGSYRDLVRMIVEIRRYDLPIRVNSLQLSKRNIGAHSQTDVIECSARMQVEILPRDPALAKL